MGSYGSMAIRVATVNELRVLMLCTSDSPTGRDQDGVLEWGLLSNLRHVNLSHGRSVDVVSFGIAHSVTSLQVASNLRNLHDSFV